MASRTITVIAAAIVALTAVASATAGEYGMPRALPSDYAAQGALGGEYGMPRALPSDYGSRTSNAVGRGQYGMPRALPSDYAVLTASRAPGTGLDWSIATAAAASLPAALALAALVGFSIRTMRRRPRPAA